MINLLPPFEKQKLLVERKWKIILILGMIVLIFFVTLILALIFVNFSISTQLKSQQILLENKNKEAQVANVQELKNSVLTANRNISAITGFYGQEISMTDFLGKISGMLPKGIYLTNILINPLGGSQNNFQVSLAGHADSIDNVIALNEKLQQESQFSQISFPPATWFEKSDFSFSVVFEATIGK